MLDVSVIRHMQRCNLFLRFMCTRWLFFKKNTLLCGDYGKEMHIMPCRRLARFLFINHTYNNVR